MAGGSPQLYVGRHTDVLDGCAKSEGLSMLMRGMNPQVAAVDEITDPTDVEAVVQAAGCGVVLLATAHGLDRADLEREANLPGTAFCRGVPPSGDAGAQGKRRLARTEVLS